jgi:nucleoside-diphosphate-sugar epimerase
VPTALVTGWSGLVGSTLCEYLAARGLHGIDTCYYSDLRKITAHDPEWGITSSLQETVAAIVDTMQARLSR